MRKCFLLISIVFGIICYSNSKVRNEMILKSFKEIKIKQKVIKEYLNGTLQDEKTVSYIYANGVVSSIKTKTKNEEIFEYVEMKYQNGKLIEMIMDYPALKNRNPSTIKKVFNYDNNLIKSINTDDSGRQVLEILYYNNLNQLTKAEVIENGKVISEKKYTYFEDGNLAKKTFLTNTSKSVYRYNSYDDKNNSFGLVFSDPFLKINIISKNNPITENNDGKKKSYKYEYNDDKYPVKITEKSSDGNKSVTTIEYD